MKIVEAFKKADNSGLFQTTVMLILAFTAAFHGMQTSSSNFISGQPERWCKIDRLENFSYRQQKDIAIPYDSEGEYDSCHAFDLDWDNFTSENFLKWNRSLIEGTADTVPCDEFVYSKEEFLETAISKWNLVCSNSVLGEMISTAYVAGLFLGSVSSGRFSDTLGRRTSEFGFGFLLVITLFTAAFVPNAIVFVVVRFLVGFTIRGTNISASVLMMELSGPKQREFAGILVPGFFAIGVMICSGCAFALRDFQLLHIVMGGIATSLLLGIIVIPESPRWLLAKGKVKQAKKSLQWIGQVNNSPLPQDFTLEAQETSVNKTNGNLSYLDLFKYPVTRKHIIIMHILWVAVNFSHMAMTLNLGALTGNAYLNVFLSGMTELPASIVVLFSMKHLGRMRTFLIFGVIFSACNGIAIPFELIPDLRIGASISTILARAAASALLCDLRVLTAELFPTILRQRVLGAVTGLAAAVGISGPYIGGSLRNVWRPLPNMIFGSLGVVAVVLAMFLPETKGRGLPETLEDAIATGKKGPKKQTLDTLPSITLSMEKPKANGMNGVSNAVFVKEDDETDSIDDGVLIFHF